MARLLLKVTPCGHNCSDALRRANALYQQIAAIEKGDIGRINKKLENLRLTERRLQLASADAQSIEANKAEALTERAALDAEYAQLQQQLEQLYAATKRDTLWVRSAEGKELQISLGNIVHAHQPNAMSLTGKLLHYVVTVWNFLTDEPREANTEGGIFPAIFGTVTMVILMSSLSHPLACWPRFTCANTPKMVRYCGSSGCLSTTWLAYHPLSTVCLV